MEPFSLALSGRRSWSVDMQNDFVREGAPQEVPAARDTVAVIGSLIEA